MVLLSLALGRAGAQKPLTAATFDFQAQDRTLTEKGRQMRELVDVHLSQDPSLRTVSRVEIEKILIEQGLGVAGVTEEAAPKVGKLLGAQVLVVGRVFVVGDQFMATARVIGTETGRTMAVLVKGNPEKLDALAEELAGKIAGQLKHRNELAPEEKPVADQIKELKAQLGGKALPRVYICIKEQTIGTVAIDPAAQTEVQHILLKCGFDVVKDKSGELKKWAETYMDDGGRTSPPRLDGVDLVLIGEGISQFGTRNGNLVSCRARVELEAMDSRSGKLLASDRETLPATDLAEQIAAKTALQEAASRVALRILPEAIEKWRASNKIPLAAKKRLGKTQK
jgi:hypothetical protein